MKKIILSFLLLTGSASQSLSDLERIISPEIKNDSFYHAIYRLASTENIATILEIGSSSGLGSTEAFARGIETNPNRPTLFCVEISKPRFAELEKYYANNTQIKCYNVSSIPATAFPDKSEVKDFMKNTPSNLNQYGLRTVLGWLQQDLDYIDSVDVPKDGIELIKKENNIEHFDVVLIDGSEFTGQAEFKLIYGARFILLDDINAFKNNANYRQLLNDPNYELIEKDWQLRNGYAVFKRIEA